MGKKTSEAAKFKPTDLIPGYGGLDRIRRKGKATMDDMDPDLPGETPEERALRTRQAETLAKLDEDENRRIKGIMTAGSGTRLLRNARSSGRPTAASGAGASTGSGVAGSFSSRRVAGARKSGSLID